MLFAFSSPKDGNNGVLKWQHLLQMNIQQENVTFKRKMLEVLPSSRNMLGISSHMGR